MGDESGKLKVPKSRGQEGDPKAPRGRAVDPKAPRGRVADPKALPDQVAGLKVPQDQSVGPKGPEDQAGAERVVTYVLSTGETIPQRGWCFRGRRDANLRTLCTTCSPCLLLLSGASSGPNPLCLVCISNESERATLAGFAALGDVVNTDANSMKEIKSSTNSYSSWHRTGVGP